jgi:hypothetical protein
VPRSKTGKRRGAAFRTGIVAAAALACAEPSPMAAAHAWHKSPRMAITTPAGRARFAVETLRFAGGRSVRIVRGGTVPRPPIAPHVSLAPRIDRTQTLRFGPRPGDRVTIVRGGSTLAPNPPPRRRAGEPGQNIEVVRFADARFAPVTIVRERFGAPAPLGVDLFGPASGDELDRIAFAVDGIESRHGADLAMWRPELDGPQGPMQVSLAAAIDVGGGDRFDLQQNRRLGRAYLAQMFRRYGNWPDALAAYNWGPANVDTWIAGGRNPDALPLEVAWYIRHVLRDAMIATASGR